MDKQQSDHIENRFRQAADNFLPPQNEEAWKRMEALLDKDPDRRKPFILWWMLALLLFGVGGGGTYYYLHNRHQETSTITKAQRDLIPSGEDRKNKGNRPAPVITGIPKNQVADGGKDVSQQRKETTAFATDTQSSRKDFSMNRKEAMRTKPVVRQRNQVGSDVTEHKLSGKKRYAAERSKKERLETSDKSETAFVQTSIETTDPGAALVLAPYQQPFYMVEVKVPDSLLKHSDSQPVLQDSLQTAIKNAISKAAKQNTHSPKFYFIASAGVNATNLQKFGTKNIGTVLGGEIGYQLNPIFSIQAGFHAGRKTYTAGPGDYTPKTDSYLSRPYVKILKINADCYIFDLPLSARVNIFHNNQHALFATTGLSSFIMNKEDYQYHYNNSSGYQYKTAGYKGNVDWLTSAHFSVGFEQRLFGKFYLQAEPYAKIPLTGIGEGKVKLYSLGIQLGLKYQPQKQK